MKLPVFPLLFTLCCSGAVAFAQDNIIPKSGEQIRAKVLRVNESEIEYKLFDYQEGPMHTLLKSDVVAIVYQNGARDSFSTAQSGYDGSLNLTEKGNQDAKQYYDGYKPAMTGAIVSGVLMGTGIIPGVIIYCTPPAYESLHYPSSALMENPTATGI